MRNPFRTLFERRSIGSSYDLLQLLLRGQATVSGQTVSESTAFNVAAVLTGVAIRSRLLAALPIDIIEKIDARSSRDAVNHPLRRVLLKPNSWQTRFELVAMLEVHRLLRGNGYAWINRVTGPSGDGIDRDQVAELVPMHPDQVEVLDPVDDFTGPSAYRLHKKNGQVLPLAAREVLHLRSISTDGRMGRSFLQDMREVIGGALATQEHANSLWSRDATPSIALTHPKALSDKAKKNLEDSWEATYGRGRDKKRIAVIEEGMGIEQLSLTPEDGQFLETQQDLRAQIAAALMVPPHLMGLAEKSTSWGTGIAEQNTGLLTITLGPDMRAWEERLQRDLLTRPDKYQIKFNPRALMRGAFDKQIDTLVRGIQGSIYSVNDARGWLDMNPVPGGDVYLQPVNYAPLGFDPSKDAAAAASPAVQKALDDYRASVDRLAAALEASKQQPAPVITVDARTTIEKGAIAHHAAPTTVEAAHVTVEAPHVEAPITIADGAIRTDVHVTGDSTKTVRKRVERDADGRITGVTEEQT